MKQTERNFWLDVSLFVTCLATVSTGLLLWLLIPHQAAAVFLGFDRHFWLTAHICSGLTSVAGSVLHVVWHRLWLKALRGRRIASLPAKIRSNRVMDRYVWFTFIAMNVFGALDWIIPTPENSVSILSRLHVAFGMACLLGIAVHLALHSKWIISTVKRNLQGKSEGMEITRTSGVKGLTTSNR
jgi:hypothetical protein